MALTIDQLLADIKRRDASHDGIATALKYVSTIGPCLDDGRCAAQFFDPHGPAQWEKTVREAADKLVYRNADMNVEESDFANPGGRKHCLGTFDFILTSTKQDRDGDVLESAGAQIDEASPLLWQHIPLSPVGGYDKTIRQDKSFVKSRASIADVPLGHDTCVFIEFGALRISHGFKPLEFAPLKRDKNDPSQEPGFHITKFVVMEVSVVSVPSNTDAVIGPLDRNKLHSPLAKAWAKSLKEKLAPMVTSGFQASEPAPVVVPVQIDLTIKGGACTCGTKNDSGAPAGAQQKPNAGGNTANDDMEASLDKAMKGIRHAGNAMGFMHKGDAGAHWSMGDGDGDDDDHDAPKDIRTKLSACKGVQSVKVSSKGYHPPQGKGWTKLFPKKEAWNMEPSDADKAAQTAAWFAKHKDAVVPVPALTKLFPGVATFPDGLKVGELAQKLPANMAQLCDKIRDEEHPHQTCVDMVAGWEGMDDPHAFCGWLQSQCGTPSPRSASVVQKADSLTFIFPRDKFPYIELDKLAGLHVTGIVLQEKGDTGTLVFHTKAGKTLSAANYTSLKTAHDMIDGAVAHPQPDAMHAMAKAARMHIKTVLDTGDALTVSGGPNMPRTEPGQVQPGSSGQPPATISGGNVQPAAAISGGNAQPPKTLSADTHDKGGRSVSKANMAMLKDAHDMLLHGHDMANPDHAKGMYKAAQMHVKTVLDTAVDPRMHVDGGTLTPPTTSPVKVDTDKAAGLVSKLYARLLEGDEADPRALVMLKDSIESRLEQKKRQRVAAAFANGTH